jgi:hypothetical protein
MTPEVVITLAGVAQAFGLLLLRIAYKNKPALWIDIVLALVFVGLLGGAPALAQGVVKTAIKNNDQVTLDNVKLIAALVANLIALTIIIYRVITNKGKDLEKFAHVYIVGGLEFLAIWLGYTHSLGFGFMEFDVLLVLGIMYTCAIIALAQSIQKKVVVNRIVWIGVLLIAVSVVIFRASVNGYFSQVPVRAEVTTTR